MTSIKTLPKQCITAGDTWGGIAELSIKVGGQAPLAPLASVVLRMERAFARPAVIVELTSANPAQIQILDPLLWRMKIGEQIIAGLTAGRWEYQITCTDAAGGVQTYFQGEFLVNKKI